MKKNHFIEFIDTYKERNYISNVQYNHILYESQQNFTENMCYGQNMEMSFNNKFQPILPVEIVEKPKLKMNIDNIEINDISDLIQLTEKYPEIPNSEYNVDLKTIRTILPELNSINDMIGMHSIKISIVEQLLYFIQKLHVNPSDGDFKHTVICGPPGTGKSEIAKLMGQMYSKIGVLNYNIFKKATRSDLIAGFLGQTAIKTQKLIDDCLGGVLFIDEAYSLAPYNDSNGDSFSKECIDTLCENLSVHKEKLMVIIAGYENELDETFFRLNRGLESRFIWRFNIESYTPDELAKIFVKKVKEQEWILDIEMNVLEIFIKKHKNEFKHYGRDIESLFLYTKISHGRKQFGKNENMKKHLTLENLEDGFTMFQKHKKKDTSSKQMQVLSTMFV